MRGIGILADLTSGELTETNLNIIANDECYEKFLNYSENNAVSNIKYGSPAERWKRSRLVVAQSLYDGITDQLLCTTTACNPDEVTRENRLDKCVS